MMRSRTDDRARRMYDYLLENLNHIYRYADVFKALGMTDNATNRAAIRKVRELAAADDLCCHVPCPANGFVFAVTDDPTAVIDPMLWMSRVEQGERATNQVQQDFVKSRMRQMEPKDRALTKAYMEVEDAMRAAQAGVTNLTKALLDIRRENKADKS